MATITDPITQITIETLDVAGATAGAVLVEPVAKQNFVEIFVKDGNDVRLFPAPVYGEYTAAQLAAMNSGRKYRPLPNGSLYSIEGPVRFYLVEYSNDVTSEVVLTRGLSTSVDATQIS